MMKKLINRLVRLFKREVQSVETILSGFQKTVDKLTATRDHHEAQSADKLATADALVAQSAGHKAEAAKAQTAALKISALIA